MSNFRYIISAPSSICPDSFFQKHVVRFFGGRKWLNSRSNIFFHFGAVVEAQLAERSIPTPEVRSSNPVIGEFLKNIFVLSTVLKRRNWKEVGNGPPIFSFISSEEAYSGYGRRLVTQRTRVRILAQYTRCISSHVIVFPKLTILKRTITNLSQPRAVWSDVRLKVSRFP